MRRMESDIPKSALASIQRGTLGYRYKGVPCLKNPFDLALYMRLVWETRPGTIIEIGSAAGGSALFYADLMRNYRTGGHVYSADLNPVTNLEDDCVSFIEADATNLESAFGREFLKGLARPWLIIDDAAHTYDVTGAILRFFAPHMRPGEYIVVEDGIVNDLEGELYRTYQNGPNSAIDVFLKDCRGRFEIDTSYCDYYGHNFTYCTNGYIRCVGEVSDR